MDSVSFDQANVAADQLMIYVSKFPASIERSQVNVLLIALFKALGDLEVTSVHSR